MRGDARVRPEAPACPAWEPPLDCTRCAACCGPAYDAVEVGPREPVLRRHPELVEVAHGRRALRRTPSNWCAALAADLRCRVYDDRPRTCRDFERGGPHCLHARRRLGLSPALGALREAVSSPEGEPA